MAEKKPTTVNGASLKAAAGNSPEAQEKASMPNKKETLPSGAIAEYLPFKGRHVMQAQRLSDGDQVKAIPAMIATATLINGKPVVIEELFEMDGVDFLALSAHYQGLF